MTLLSRQESNPEARFINNKMENKSLLHLPGHQSFLPPDKGEEPKESMSITPKLAKPEVESDAADESVNGSRVILQSIIGESFSSRIKLCINVSTLTTTIFYRKE